MSSEAETINVVFIGLDKAGKSSIKIYLESLNVNKAMNTKMSNNIERYQRGRLRIDVFPGQKLLRYNEKLYEILLPNAKRLVFVVDAADRERFDEVKKYWVFVKKMLEKYQPELKDIILVAHKQDLPSAISGEELKKIVFDEYDLRRYNITTLETSIYDIVSMSLLLRAIHGAHKVGIEDLIEALRMSTNASVAFIFDGHILPIAISSTMEKEKLLDVIMDILASLERFGDLKAIVALYRSGRKLLIISEERLKDHERERVIVGVLDFNVSLDQAMNACRNTITHYISELRNRFWGL